MTAPIIDGLLKDWLEMSPALCNDPEEDARILARHVKRGKDLLSRLPPKSQRSNEDLIYAAAIHSGSRRLRKHFMGLHADWLYKVLTSDCMAYRTLKELAFGAAERCPGLVPTSEEISKERQCLQADKEGLEIDQGLFFSALLSSLDIGLHLVEGARTPTARSHELISQFHVEGQLDLGSVFIEKRGSVAHLTLNNPHSLNAEDDRLVDDLETAVDLTLLDEDIHVGVVRGAVMTHPRYEGRRVFCSGINLKALHGGKISFVDFLLRRELGFINKIIRGLVVKNKMAGFCDQAQAWKSHEKPWIAVVDSFAIGGGAQLLLAFDRVIAASDSYFSLPAAQEGIIPGFSNLRLGRFLGNRRTRQLILSGRKIWAYEPDAALLFDEIVDTGDLEAAVERSTQELANPAVIANRHLLNIVEEPLQLFLNYAAEFALIQAERLYSQDVLGKINRFSVRTQVRQ